MLHKTYLVNVTDKNGRNYKHISNPVLHPPSYYSGITYFIEENKAVGFMSLFDVEKNSKHNISSKDVIYASKASEIPRFKLKEFIKENKLKKTSRVQYSTAIIVNREYFNELKTNIEVGEFYFLKGKYILANKDKCFNNGYNGKDLNEVAKGIINSCDDIDMLISISNKKDLKNVFNNHPKFKNEIESNSNLIQGLRITLYRQQRLVDLFEILLIKKDDILNGKCKIIFDDDLFVDLNKEGIELDDDYLISLRHMLFSEDRTNVKLGFEMISNLVVTKPMLLSVSFLLNEMYYQTRFRPSYYSSENTNLKSLLKLLKSKKIFWEHGWKSFGTGLRMNFKDGKEGEIVKQFLIDNINREFKLSNTASDILVDIVFETETK